MKSLKSILTGLPAWFRRYNELPMLIISILLFFAAGQVLILINPTSGLDDPGWLHRTCTVAYNLFAALLTAGLAMRFSFPEAHKFLFEELSRELFSADNLRIINPQIHLQLCHKRYVALTIFWSYVSAFLVLLFALR
ncbi:MAG: hypothetical protein V4543_00630 [Bacteroidota bacterium]